MTALASAFSSMIPPRAVLTIRTPGLARASRSAPSRPVVSGVFGRWMVRKSASATTSFERQQLRAQLLGSLGADVGIVGQQSHAEGGGPLGDQGRRPGPGR